MYWPCRSSSVAFRNLTPRSSSWRIERTVSFLPASTTTSPVSASMRSAETFMPFMRSPWNGKRQPSFTRS